MKAGIFLKFRNKVSSVCFSHFFPDLLWNFVSYVNKIMIMKHLILSIVMVFGLFEYQTIAQEKMINKHELPIKSQTFLSDYFSDYEISYIVEVNEFLISKDYKVTFSNAIEIEFDSDGSWEEVDGNDLVIPDGFIPTSIKDYIKKSFTGNKITKIEKNRRSYEVQISNGLDLEFNADGKFKRIDD